ncbi:PepSY-associated TM helix domain-containing protein [Alteromonas halophila]|uniref:PepSY domain-containing protein n=1 Tax=Alteromonas halophila TaxID=516698 RepID=A0A918JNR2_9ALTE|nr:PepSY-associated TM helix domain-containing protein [Alteromonas halophila]GGW86599.1 hypothetical protein GCM10007391_20380 [Alteromonas halophila]
MRLSFAQLNQRIHTWLGLLLSLWVLLMAVTGTALYYKPALLKLTYPVLDTGAPLSQTAAAVQLDSLPPQLDHGYAYMPTRDAPWLEVVDTENTRWYYGESGLLLKREAHSDVIDVFVSLHHDLMLGDTGKDVQGFAGLASLLLLITGTILWWPRHRLSRRHFTIHWFSLKSRKGLQTLAEMHKVSAVIFLLPMVLLLGTGTAIIYSQPVNSALVGLFPSEGQQPLIPTPAPTAENWQQRLSVAQSLFTNVSPRLIYLSKDRLRLKHEDEWHPNGRNYIGFDTTSGVLAEREDVRQTAYGNQLSHTIYPLHVAAVGGVALLAVSTLAGLILILLPLTGISYWVKRRRYRPNAHKKPTAT